MPKDTNFISIADKILGTPGKVIFWLMYLFLFLTVMIAHGAGGSSVLREITGIHLSDSFAAIIYTAVLAPIVYLGARSVDRLNMFLISGVPICYLAFFTVSISPFKTALLSYVNWAKAGFALPVLFTAFTYQVIISSFLRRKARADHFNGFCPLDSCWRGCATLHMKKDRQFIQAREDVFENLEALQILLERCVDEGSVYYNELVDLKDDAEIITTWEELEELVTRAKTIEVDIDAWLSIRGNTTISMLWPKQGSL